MCKNPKSVSDLIVTSWEIENAAAEIEQQNRTRIDVVINCKLLLAVLNVFGCRERYKFCVTTT